MEMEQLKISTAVVKCQCGADMFYHPKKGAVVCPYCDSQRAVDKHKALRRNFATDAGDGKVDKNGIEYKCPNCDGSIKINSYETSVKCPFCGSTNIIKTEELKGIKPDSILPFLLDKEDAVGYGKKWIKKKLFAPSKAKKSFSPSNFAGLYLPTFAYTTQTSSDYNGKVGYHRTRTVTRNGKTMTETYTEWRYVSGSINLDFADLQIESSTHLTQKELDKIKPYDFENIEAYNKDYMAGFESERYDTSPQDCFEIAKGKMEISIRNAIVRKYGADEVGYMNISTTYHNVQFRYTLSPVWECNYDYKQKIYRYIVNGRNGNAYGQYPKSPFRILIAVLLGLAVVAGIVYLILTKGGII